MPSAEYAKRFKDMYGYISFDKGDRNGHAGMYLHCSDRGLDGWLLDQGYDCPFKSPWLGVLCLFQQQQRKKKKVILRWQNAASGQGSLFAKTVQPFF